MHVIYVSATNIKLDFSIRGARVNIKVCDTNSHNLNFIYPPRSQWANFEKSFVRFMATFHGIFRSLRITMYVSCSR